MATSPIPSHPHPVEPVTHRSQRSSHGSAPVLLMTMATTLIFALAIIVLSASDLASTSKVADAMLAVA